MNRLRWLALLMGVAILGITGFQVYWLAGNYAREKQSLSIRSEAVFRETILELQVAKLRLDPSFHNGKDSGNENVRVFINDDHQKEGKLKVKPKARIISTVNVIREKMKDSLKRPGVPSPLIISLNKSSTSISSDSIRFRHHIPSPGGSDNVIFNLLYGVDSLQDSLRVSEIDSAYSKKLKTENIDIPYTITRSTTGDADDGFNEVSVGFANPVTYKLEPGNSFAYLIKRISLPILFSIILIGITVLSFILLYRNMLKQQRLAELKNEFISNITHELKTPIATVGVAIEALKSFNAMQDPRRMNEYLDISSNELQRLGFMVDKVLKLSMFEKKEVDLRYEPVDLRQLVDEVTDSLKLQFEKYEATVEVEQEGNVNMEGDRLHLLSVVFNLLDNGLKYSKEKPVINIRLSEKEDKVVMTVTDKGIGIPEAYKEKIFEKFFRVPQGNIHNAKGYGLGLSYAAEVVKKHKGTISAESEPGKGTTFTITFPKQKP